jgi:hypothetical protein
VQDHLVDEPRLQCLGHDAAAHEVDVLVAGGSRAAATASSMPVVTSVWRSEIRGTGRWLTTNSGAVGWGKVAQIGGIRVD